MLSGLLLLRGWLSIAALQLWAAAAQTTAWSVHDASFRPNIVLRLSLTNVTAACISRPAVVVNGSVPGPPVHLPAGQTTWIRVFNDVPDRNVTVHWHGLSASTAPFSDGAPLASQWPIPSSHFFDYEIYPTVDEPGTYFYHSHVDFQAVTASGPLIVYDPVKPAPYAYDDERIFFVSEQYRKNDSAIIDGVLASPFDWPGEPDALLVNGQGMPMCNGTRTDCSPAIIQVEPHKTYRFRTIGGQALTQAAFCIAEHANLTVIAADGRYTLPASTDHIQVASGQRFDFLLATHSRQWLHAQFGSRPYYDFEIELADLFRPRVVAGRAVLRYQMFQPSEDHKEVSGEEPCESRCASTTRANTTLEASSAWLEYTLSPLNDTVALMFPQAPDVTKRVIVSNMQVQQQQSRRVVWNLNSQTWVDDGGTPGYRSAPGRVPYLVRIHEEGEAAVPCVAEQEYGFDFFSLGQACIGGTWNESCQSPFYDPLQNAYKLQKGDVVEIIMVNAAGYSGKYDVHPWHIHGGHYYDIGSGPGMYDPRANEEKLARLFTTQGLVPAVRDTTMLYRYPADNSANRTMGTPGGWRGWRVRVDDPGVWMVHCHSLQHMAMGMQSVWVMGEAHEIVRGDLEADVGYDAYGANVSLHAPMDAWAPYTAYGGQAYGNLSWDPVVRHHFLAG